MIAALECRQPAGAVPLWELHFHCWDQVSSQRIVLGREFERLPPPEQDRALGRDVEVMLSVAEELGFSAMTIPDGYWEIAPGEPSYSWLPQEARLELMRRLRRAADPDLMLIAASGGVISMPGASEYVEFCYKLFDAPQEIDERARQTLASGLEAARRMRDAGADAVYTASDIADNHGPFFSPPQMDRFILPYLHTWAEQVVEMGLYAIMHADGNLDPVLDDLAASGIQALQAIDPVAGMDIASVKRRIGDRVCLCGNVDCGLLLTGPGQEVYASTRELLKTCMPGGGFVLGASNAVDRRTPIAHYREMLRARRDFGSYHSTGGVYL
jgi:uroporphyrinogen decarboxylase